MDLKLSLPLSVTLFRKGTGRNREILTTRIAKKPAESGFKDGQPVSVPVPSPPLCLSAFLSVDVD